MKALVAVVALVLAAAPGESAAAQTRQGWLKSPVLVFQPGLVFTNVIDAPDDADGGTDLLLRVVTAVPTALPRLMLVAGVQWAPTADENGAGVSQNQPEFHYGPVVHLFDGRRVAADLGVLGAYGPSATAEDAEERAYSHKLRLQGDVFLKLGGFVAERPASRWERAAQRTALYLMLANTVSGVDAEVASRWTVQAGVSLPIAP